MNHDKNNEEGKKTGSFWSSLLWWRLNKEEVQQQVDDYEILKITQSARGISLLCLLLSAVITTIFVLFFNFDNSAFFDVVLFLILGFFVYKGHQWAMIGAMILWTYDKIYLLVTQNINSHVNTPSVIASLLWWAFYMHAFYLAFRVERIRIKPLKTKFTKNNLADLEKLAELKNKGIITEEEFSAKKKQILGL